MNRRSFFKRAAGAAAIPVAAAVAAALPGREPSADELIAAAKSAQAKAFNAQVAELERKIPVGVWEVCDPVEDSERAMRIPARARRRTGQS